MQGANGQAGDRGVVVAGLPGVAGPSGLQGVRGQEGLTGEQGVAGVVGRWTTYRDFDFDRTDVSLRPSEMDRITEIAAYLVQNPSLEVGIDGSLNERLSRNSRDLSNRRADSVRDALMQAGVPAYKIQMGRFADPDRRHEGQIEVLIKTRA
jgi:outer membrane protein OmpA-like peptidoglycan-associated protein